MAKRAVVAVPFLLLALLPAACGEAPRSAAPQALAVTDDVGREVRLDAPARRVVSLVPAATELIVALGAAEVLVARTDFDTDTALAHLPSVGGGLTPNLEWIAARRPDVVIAWPDHSTRTIAERLGQLGVAVYGARGETLEDGARTTRNLGVLLGRAAAADSLNARVDAELRDVMRTAAARDTPRVLYVVALEPAVVAGPGNFIDQLIEVAGGRNAFADAASPWPQIGLEEAVRRDPDLVVLAVFGSDGDPVARLRRTPGWREVPAVRAGRIVYADPFEFNRWGPGLPRTARRLAQWFHSDSMRQTR